jgi:hypothetical protein
MIAFAEWGRRRRPRAIDRGSNVKSRFSTNAAKHPRHCRIDGSFRLRAACIDGSHVAGPLVSDGNARANESHFGRRRDLCRVMPRLRGD